MATSAQLDSFVKVKAAIDKMVAELSQQQEEEVKHRDWCHEELHQNAVETAANEDKKTSLEVKISDLEKDIETLTADIRSTKDAIAEMQKQMKRAGVGARRGSRGQIQLSIRPPRSAGAAEIAEIRRARWGQGPDVHPGPGRSQGGS